jgi:hypothetical protein
MLTGGGNKRCLERMFWSLILPPQLVCWRFSPNTYAERVIHPIGVKELRIENVESRKGG